MANAKPPASQRVTDAFRRLAESSQNLEAAVNEWKPYISALNGALRQLNIGIAAWHVIFASGGDDSNPQWSTREIGYSKVKDEWCIALRRSWGNQNYPDFDEEETWRFEDAPRWLMVEAAARIPDLIETLVQRTDRTAENVRKRSQETAEVAAALEPLLQELSARGAGK